MTDVNGGPTWRSEAWRRNAARAQRARFGSLPNILTYGRILAIPALVACFFVDRRLGPLDRDVDLHRRRRHRFPRRLSRARLAAAKQLGRMLDPIADKLIVAAALLMLRRRPDHRRLVAVGGVIILCREILVSGLREFLGTLAVSVPVTRLAKWKTLIQMVAIGFLLGGQRRRQDLALHHDVRAFAAVDRGALHALHRLRLSLRRDPPRHEGE